MMTAFSGGSVVGGNMSRKTLKCLHAACGWVAFAPLALFVGGCTVGPDYHPPQTRTLQSWSEIDAAPAPPPSTGPATEPATSASRATATPMNITRWWTTFQDPMLDALVEQALRWNYDVRLADSRIREARAQRAYAIGGLLPSVNANGSYSHSRVSQTGIPIPGVGAGNSGFSPTVSPAVRRAEPAAASGSSDSSSAFPFSIGPNLDLFQLGFDASWELDVFGGTRRQVEAATADLAARIEDRRSSQVTLLAEVARNYLELRGVQKQLEIARATVESQKQTLKLVQERRSAGMQTELDVARAASQVATTYSQIPMHQSQIRQTIHRLAILLGREPAALSKQLLPDAPLPPLPASVPVGLPSELLRRRPDIRRAERDLAAATARTGAATADLFPRFSLTGQLGLQTLDATKLFNSNSLFYSIGPSITWPVFDRGRIKANIVIQSERQEQALLQYEKTVITGLKDVEDALIAYSTEQLRWRALRDAVTNDRRAVKIARDQYHQGVTDFLTVLDTERTLLRSEDSLAQSEQTVSTNLVALYKALGGGWEVGERER